MHANTHPRTDPDGWRDHAACKGHTDLFFPQRGENGGDLGHVARAKAICADCPSLDPCRTFTLTHVALNEPGIWAGMTRDERRTAARALRPPRPNTADTITKGLASLGGTWHGSAGALGSHLGIERTAITNAVARMEQRGQLIVDPPAPRTAGHPIRTIRLP